MRRTIEITEALFSKTGFAPTIVALPHTWNNLDGQDGGNDYWRGTGTYEIHLPDPTPGKRQYIEFQAANHMATVYCNGQLMGTHKGGFSTFRYDLTGAMKQSDNILRVQVFNGVCNVYPQRADFTFYGGLYRSVRLIEVEQAHFDLLMNGSNAVFVTADDTGETRFDVFPVDSENCRVSVDIFDSDGNVVSAGAADADSHTVISLDVRHPHLWDGVANPYCYTAAVKLLHGEELLDEVQVVYGYRSFRAVPDTGFWLNGKNVPLRGVCRHQDRKDMGWAITKVEHDEDAKLIQQVGANTVRLAHYQHDQYFYDLCDRYGFVVWAEIPFISQFMEGEEAYANTISQMKELIAQCYNHPSICFWGISNEITIGGYSDELLRNLCDLHALCKTMDPGRLTTMAQLGNVPIDSAHTQITDVQSYNYYLGWYSGSIEDNAQRMDAWHAANPNKVYGLSEYGADNYPCWHSANPFNHDYTEEYSVLYHHEMLKTIEKRPYLWGTYVWNMFDFAADARDEGGFKGINAKGLVSYDRRLPKDAFYLYKAYWNPEPMVHICSKRFVERAPDERDLIVLTNESAVNLFVNGVSVTTENAVDHKVIFKNVAFTAGKNVVLVKTDHCADTTVFFAVDRHNESYDVPDIAQALSAGNWFLTQTTEGEAANDYTVHTPAGVLFANDRCLQIVRGWLMASQKMPESVKMTAISRLTNYRFMWAEKTIDEIPAVKRHMTEEDLLVLDSMLRRVKKTCNA